METQKPSKAPGKKSSKQKSIDMRYGVIALLNLQNKMLDVVLEMTEDIEESGYSEQFKAKIKACLTQVVLHENSMRHQLLQLYKKQPLKTNKPKTR